MVRRARRVEGAHRDPVDQDLEILHRGPGVAALGGVEGQCVGARRPALDGLAHRPGPLVTHGCVRMFPWDIEALYKVVPVGTPVTIVNQPYKLGWTEQGLYLEAHPPLATDAPKATDEPSRTDTAEADVPLEGSLTELTRAYVAATQTRRADMRWDVAETVIRSARGLPELITTGPPAVKDVAAANKE